MTLEEAQLALAQTNDAIAKLISGKQLNRLEVGSGSFKRVYEYRDISLDSLKEYRDELLGIIHSFENSSPVFRNNSSFRIVGTKG